MAMLPEQFIQQVLQATDIVSLIERYVALKKRGREFVGLCPFHDDKRPSMYVSPTKQIFKCFACGAGGDAIGFVMKYEKLSFMEAVRMLAEQAGMAMPQLDHQNFAPAQPGMGKNDLAAVTEFAARFYQDQLGSPSGQGALAYAHSRGLTDETIQKFRIGFAPDSWDAFITAARQQGFAEQQLFAAGMMRQRENSSGGYDWFRNRLMFPIRDLGGRVIGFGGRALADGENAKYLNSPESVLFDKSSLVFDMSLARESIVASRQAVVVEGYMDVIVPHQAGVTNLVATLGTALTEQHVRLLARYAEEVVLMFDADTAGAAAAQRALELFIRQQFNVRVATIPSGKDPCDMVLAQGPDALRSLIAGAPDALQYVWDRRYEQYSHADNPAARRKIIEDFLQLIASSAAYGAVDAVRQQNISQHIAHLLNMSAIDVNGQIRRLVRKIKPRGLAAQPQTPSQSNSTMSLSPERQILEVLLDKPELFDEIVERIDPPHFEDPLCRAIAEQIWHIGVAGKFTLESLMAQPQFTEWQGLLAELSFAGQRRGNHSATLNDAVNKILQREHYDELTQLKNNLSDDDSLRSLGEKLSHAAKQTNRLKRPRIF